LLIGDQTASNSPDPSYLVRAPRVEADVELVVGVISLVIVLAYWLTAISAVRREGTVRTWLPVVACLTAAGVVSGYSGRVLTAGADGANIGAGFVLLLGPLVLVGLLGFAIVRSVLAVRGRGGSSTAPAGWYQDPDAPGRWRWWSGTAWAPTTETQGPDASSSGASVP
jgi:hypothetical protein